MAGYDKAMDIATLRAILDSEKQAAVGALRASKLSSERTKALDYYLGDISSDVSDQPGKSSAVSSDVADTIEGLLPMLMDIFTGADEICKFEPVAPNDVDAAEQETNFVNHVFMEQNPGFLILYSFMKDALLSKTGIVKVAWDSRYEEEEDTYYDLTDMQLTMLINDPDIEIIAHTVKDQPAASDPDFDPAINPSYS